MARAVKDLVGAAAKYTQRRFAGHKRQPDSSWQETAWDLYSSTPELRYVSNWVGNSMGRGLLYAGRRAPDGTVEPVPDTHPAADLVAGIAGGPTGQAELLREFGPHLVVAGEGWVIIRPRIDQTGTHTGEDWRVLSVLEVKKQSGRMEAEIDGEPTIIPQYDEQNPDPGAPVAIRVWDPHPRRYLEADSPTRSSLVLLEELRLLNAAVAAIAKSRLRGRGVLFVPQGTKFPTSPTQNGAEDDLLEVFMQVAETAYREPDSAAAGVPIILEVPEAALGKWEWLRFESDFDELAVKLRDECIRRFATGIEIPAEILLGMSDASHWNAWQIESSAVQLAIEPRLATVADALTKYWLQPMLEDQNVPDADEILVWFDTSPLRVRQNRSQTAIEVYREGVISAEALRRETGFDDGDAPTSDERTRTLTEDEAANVTQATTTLPADETTGPPDTFDDAVASTTPTVTASEGLIAAADGVIYRALERAGVRHRGHQPRSIRPKLDRLPATTMHIEVPVERAKVDEWRLLDGAWERVPEIASRYGVDPDCLITSLHAYTFELIAAGVAHDFDVVPGVIAPCLTASQAE